MISHNLSSGPRFLTVMFISFSIYFFPLFSVKRICHRVGTLAWTLARISLRSKKQCIFGITMKMFKALAHTLFIKKKIKRKKKNQFRPSSTETNLARLLPDKMSTFHNLRFCYN